MSQIDKLRSLFGWTASPEPEFLLFKAVAGVLPPMPADSANAPMLADLLKKDSKLVTWEEIQAGKVALVAVMPLETLQARFGSLTDEYESVTGDKAFAQGAFANPPTTIEGWHAGVVSLLEELTKFRRAKLMFERVRSAVGMTFGFLLLGIVFGGFILAELIQEDKITGNLPLWAVLLFTGLCGAVFSVLSRLYSLKWTPRLAMQIDDVQALKKGLVINCILSMAEGVVAAWIIYLLFASGLIKGSLFPEFPQTAPDSHLGVIGRFEACQPQQASELAKLLAWAFIAGFVERLIPDKLNQLAGQASEANK